MPSLPHLSANLNQTIRNFALLTAALAAAVIAGALIAKQAPHHRYHNGIDAPRAVAAARKFAGLPHAPVLSTRSGIVRDFDFPGSSGPGEDDQVWAVTIAGTFSFSCGPIPTSGVPHACPPPAKTMTVMVDYHDAHVLFGEYSGPPAE